MANNEGLCVNCGRLEREHKWTDSNCPGYTPAEPADALEDAKAFICNHELWDGDADKERHVQELLDVEVQAWMADYAKHCARQEIQRREQEIAAELDDAFSLNADESVYELRKRMRAYIEQLAGNVSK